jgi:hypothetical protein
MKDLIEAKLPRSEQPLLFLRMHIAQYMLLLGKTKECKAAVGDGKQSLDAMGDVSPSSVSCMASASDEHVRCSKAAWQEQGGQKCHRGEQDFDTMENQHLLRMCRKPQHLGEMHSMVGQAYTLFFWVNARLQAHALLMDMISAFHECLTVHLLPILQPPVNCSASSRLMVCHILPLSSELCCDVISLS